MKETLVLLLVLFLELTISGVYPYTFDTPEDYNEPYAVKRSRNSRGRQRGRQRNGIGGRRGLQGRRGWQSLIRSTNPEDWSTFAPPPPTGDDVECHFEVEVIQPIDGRCIILGGSGRLPVCQSGIHLDLMNPQCYRIMAARRAREQQQAEGTTETPTVTQPVTPAAAESSSES